MSANAKVSTKEIEPTGRMNRTLYKLTGFLGLTTGVGVIAWGVWSLFATVGTYIYEETGISLEEIVINNAFNEGMLLSAVVIALGVIILEIKKIQRLMVDEAARDAERRGD